MGQSLSNTAVWTSATENGESKLEYTSINQSILDSIISFTESFPSGHAELANITFQKPLTWTTVKLKPADLSGAFSQKGDETVSDAQDKSGQPYCRMVKNGSSYEISVYSMEYCAIVLKSAGENKMNECRACLEANRDPTANMLGDRFAHVSGPDSSAYRFVAEIMTAQPPSGGDEDGQDTKEDGVEEKKLQLKMLFIILDFDKKLLEQCIKEIASGIRLTPQEVDRTVKLLQGYCGQDEERYPLEHIGWPELYSNVYENGNRATPWRQVHGDIHYIEVKTHECGEKPEDLIYITASTNGYYVNEDFYKNYILQKPEDSQAEEPSKQNIKYYKDLINLLREISPAFNAVIDKQEYFKSKEESRRGILDTTEDTSQQEQEHKGDTTTRSEKKDQRDRGEGEKKKKSQQKKKLEPSLKWKTLTVEDEEEERQKKTQVQKKKKDPKSGKVAPSSDAEDSFVESDSESEEEEETVDRRSDNNTDLPSEYWQIQKLVKYLKGGNQTATIIALCSMRDFNLQQETCQLAIRDVGGLEVLINLLDTEEIKCKIGALKILKEISKNTQIRRAIADLGGLQTMVKILRSPNKELKCLAAETIANVAKFRRARRTVRQHGGIKKTVALLDCAPIGSVMTADQEKDVEVARCGALALWSCSKSTLNKQSMRKAGAIPLLAKLLKSPHENMLIPVVGTLQECATEKSYRLAIRTEGMVEDLVKNLRSENPELQMHCASAIFKCAEEKETRDLVRQYGGLDPLVTLLNNQEDKELLAAATGAIWKCSISPENVVRFKELKAIELLVQLLNDQPEEVLVNVVGALAELAKDTANRLTIRKAGGIPPLVNLLTGTNQALLVNVTKAVGQCAEEPDNMIVIDKLDGVRLLWSLLKNQNTEVQSSAAWAICPCIENAKDAGEMVRSFVGGLELIVGLLECDDKEVLASVCAAIANIANDEENLAVITDHGVVPKLAVLTNTPEDKLRRHLAEAIARCCNWGNNRVSFGQENAVAPLVKYLKSKDKNVHRSTARALHQLSKDPDNCITMHEAGVVKPLMEMVGSDDDVLQEAAAGCISNIRRLALANEKARK